MDKVAERVAVGIARGMTRRRLFGHALRGAVGVGIAASSPLTWMSGSASADHLTNCVNVSNNWGCFCAGTASCPSTKCNRGLCNGIRKRCNYWTNQDAANYCWCSAGCCQGGLLGYYSCCDCWNGTGTAGCGSSSGQSPCICKHRHNYQLC